MKIPNLLIWFSVSATFILYLTMMFWTLPCVSKSAGGLLPFDLRYFGYGVEDVLVFQHNLSERGKDLYLGLHYFLDQTYALSLAVSSLLVLISLQQKIGSTALCLMSVSAFLGAIFDWSENHLVRNILKESLHSHDERTVLLASIMTTSKLCCQLIPILFVLLILGQQFIRSREPNNRGDS